MSAMKVPSLEGVKPVPTRAVLETAFYGVLLTSGRILGQRLGILWQPSWIGGSPRRTAMHLYVELWKAKSWGRASTMTT